MCINDVNIYQTKNLKTEQPKEGYKYIGNIVSNQKIQHASIVERSHFIHMKWGDDIDYCKNTATINSTNRDRDRSRK